MADRLSTFDSSPASVNYYPQRLQHHTPSSSEPRDDSFSDIPDQYGSAFFNNYSDELHPSTFDAQQVPGTPGSLAITKALSSNKLGVHLNTPRVLYQHPLENPRSDIHSFEQAFSNIGSSTAFSSGYSALSSSSTPYSTNAESNICTCCKCTCKASHHHQNISTPPPIPSRSVKAVKRGVSPIIFSGSSKSRCVICNKEFTRSTDLGRHCLTIHQRVRWYCILGCENNHGSGWCREDKLNEHIRRQHPGFQWE